MLGNLGGSNYASPSTPNVSAGMGGSPVFNLQFLVDGKSSGDYMAGNVFTPQFVSDQSMAAQNASMNRTQQSANTILPGLTVG